MLLDVTPLTLGVETLGGVMTAMIPRNTTIPTRKTETYTTAADSQPSVEIHVAQGERPMAAENKTLGRFHLDGIPPAQRGVPQVEVTFDIDANGILNVAARDKGTGKQQTITITASSGLSKDEVDRMVREAEQHAGEDQRRREEIEARNQADGAAYQAEKTLRDNGDKVSAELRSEVEGKVAAVRSALQGTDTAQIRSAAEELTESMQKIGQQIYQEAGAAAGAQPGAAEGQKQPGDSTVEGEFREV